MKAARLNSSTVWHLLLPAAPGDKTRAALCGEMAPASWWRISTNGDYNCDRCRRKNAARDAADLRGVIKVAAEDLRRADSPDPLVHSALRVLERAL